ncbi:D-TA family PLP-dependent enzyme [Dictyobacter aurantiacus]|uniref:Alanine racemase n=1 Tax=Dictyobacter aurantiacus TaxID=1936993 RepID=A0A401Z7T8_9CHLR|nr:D-TA family PLP-dependent enzyme [Dictyobacter aurantiacus]GCE02927.1 alanine racemase [Dictyobacter aurantiacus]
MHRDQLETPVATVDLDKLERNIARLQTHLDRYGIANRPHIKTHKIPQIARMQIEHGAVGITCQKLGEAEVMADAGIQDIFVPYNIIGERKLDRLVELARRCRMSVTADDEIVVRGLSAAMAQTGLTLPVLVECDTGLERCGVQTPEAAATLARLIADAPGLHFAGLMTYPSSERANTFVRETRALLAADQLPLERTSGGSTHCSWQAQDFSEINEHRAGEYVYGDRHALQSGALTLDELAFKVTVTVVSQPTDNRRIIDGGSKTFSSDLGSAPGYGLILEYPEAVIYSQSEEHGHVDFSACAHKPSIGERLTVIPNHCCTVTNLFNQIVGIRNEQVEVTWPVACRGLIQ